MIRLLVPLVVAVGGLVERLTPRLLSSVWPETKKEVRKSEALTFINIPCLALLLFYSAHCVGATSAVLTGFALCPF